EEKELKMLVRGLPASPGIGTGKVKNIKDISEISRVEDGDVLVTVMTNPDMVPAMRKASAVVTDEGGRTCHAAIVSRELGIPCIVGAKEASEILKDDMEITVDATRGVVYEGKVLQEEKEEKKDLTVSTGTAISEDIIHQLAPVTATKIYMNLGEPSIIDRYKHLPFDGIGLMRTEFIFSNMIGAHPMYLVKTNQGQLLIDKMSEGIMMVAQEIYPKPVVVRLSDFRTNEFRGLKGGDEVEPIENNPMIGWRGVSRYISPEYEEGFRLECRAMKKVREEYGLDNVWAMLPFVRTTWELERVKEIMAEEGLVQSNNFKIWIMAEVPSVVFEAEEFAQMVDGFSIGSNDLTQLVMGADRDSGILNTMGYFDERNEAVKRAISILIKAAHKYGKTISICGQGPSQYPEFAEFLVQEGINSISVNPDTVAYTRRLVASVEQRIILNKIREL
ncbi:MAG: phosphoenolpyruvate synthase, partial [Tissierellia bacterium]|nr:phosphoenolpyruvate synthase [Tissierellia bacterium]